MQVTERDGVVIVSLVEDRMASLGWECIEPTGEQMSRLVSPAIALVKANQVADAYEPLAEVVNDLAARGASAVVLGCTEIPLLVTEKDSPLPILDSTRLLAGAAVRKAIEG